MSNSAQPPTLKDLRTAWQCGWCRAIVPLVDTYGQSLRCDKQVSGTPCSNNGKAEYVVGWTVNNIRRARVLCADHARQWYWCDHREAEMPPELLDEEEDEPE